MRTSLNVVDPMWFHLVPIVSWMNLLLSICIKIHKEFFIGIFLNPTDIILSTKSNNLLVSTNFPFNVNQSGVKNQFLFESKLYPTFQVRELIHLKKIKIMDCISFGQIHWGVPNFVKRYGPQCIFCYINQMGEFTSLLMVHFSVQFLTKICAWTINCNLKTYF
jgi:hypothetical protein